MKPNQVDIKEWALKDQEKLLKFEAEGREFAKILRSLNRTICLNSEWSDGNRVLF